MNVPASFLGTGWSFPPTFSQGGADVETVTDAEDIQQSLQLLLATRPGERVLREDYGCDLHQFQFEEIDQSLTNGLSSLITDAILFHEPRIVLEDVEVGENEREPGRLDIRLTYTIASTNSRYNLVYPFYLNEATNPPV